MTANVSLQTYEIVMSDCDNLNWSLAGLLCLCPSLLWGPFSPFLTSFKRDVNNRLGYHLTTDIDGDVAKKDTHNVINIPLRNAFCIPTNNHHVRKWLPVTLHSLVMIGHVLYKTKENGLSKGMVVYNQQHYSFSSHRECVIGCELMVRYHTI